MNKEFTPLPPPERGRTKREDERSINDEKSNARCCTWVALCYGPIVSAGHGEPARMRRTGSCSAGPQAPLSNASRRWAQGPCCNLPLTSSSDLMAHRSQRSLVRGPPALASIRVADADWDSDRAAGNQPGTGSQVPREPVPVCPPAPPEPARLRFCVRVARAAVGPALCPRPHGGDLRRHLHLRDQTTPASA
jgi:hypothetical protein